MDSLFFNSINIENYKCFKKALLKFNKPDGKTKGSGLNIIMGENGTGKTAVLEAVNFLTQSKYISENVISASDFNDYNEAIKITGGIDSFRCKSSIGFYNREKYTLHFKSKGITFESKPRDRKESNKILSSPFSIYNKFQVEENPNYFKIDEKNKQKEYKIEKDIELDKKVDSRDMNFTDSRIKDGGLNVFYFDKNRSRHLTSGMYKTTWDKICDELNRRFINYLPKDSKKLNEIKKSITGDYFSIVLNIAQKNVGEKLVKEMTKFFDNDLYKELKIDLLDLLQPFSNASFVIRGDDQLKQVYTKSLGSGVEIIMTLFLLKAFLGGKKDSSTIYLIDEPELHLHPKAQEALARILLKESINKQIIIATHSPFMYKNLMNYSGIHTLKWSKSKKEDDEKEDISDNQIEINKKDGKKEGLLPWSPSWSEINFEVYGIASEEFHIELYGYLMELTEKYTMKDFDEFLKKKGVDTEEKEWKKKDNGNSVSKVSLHTFIRHSIHHPENKLNDGYSPEDLKKSIEKLMELIDEKEGEEEQAKHNKPMKE